jgi:hypothetical protein
MCFGDFVNASILFVTEKRICSCLNVIVHFKFTVAVTLRGLGPQGSLFVSNN